MAASGLMDLEQAECPLCLEELDTTDLSVRPCQCGYQVCLWCLHHIREQLNGKCPACRTPYEENKFVIEEVDPEEAARAIRERAEARREREKRERMEKQERERAAAAAAALQNSKRTLKHARIIQRDLVYVVGLSPMLAREEMLRRSELFGRFGYICEIYVNRVHHFNANAPGGPSMSAYIKFTKESDAAHAARVMNGEILDGREIRVAITATKYCDVFVDALGDGNGSASAEECDNPGCLYLHELAPDADVLTREEMMKLQLGPPPPPHLFEDTKKRSRSREIRPVMGPHSAVAGGSNVVINSRGGNSSALLGAASRDTASAGPVARSASNGRSPPGSPDLASSSEEHKLGSLAALQSKTRPRSGTIETSRDVGGSVWGSPPTSGSGMRTAAQVLNGGGSKNSPRNALGTSPPSSWMSAIPPVKTYPPGYVDPFEEENKSSKTRAWAAVSQRTSTANLRPTTSSTAKPEDESSGSIVSASALPKAGAQLTGTDDDLARNSVMGVDEASNENAAGGRANDVKNSFVGAPPGFQAKPPSTNGVPPGFTSGPSRALAASPPPGFEGVAPPSSSLNAASSAHEHVGAARSVALPPGFESFSSSGVESGQGPIALHESGPRDVSAELRSIMASLKGSLGLSDDYGQYGPGSAQSQDKPGHVMPPFSLSGGAIYQYSAREHSRFGFARGHSASIDSRAVESAAMGQTFDFEEPGSVGSFLARGVGGTSAANGHLTVPSSGAPQHALSESAFLNMLRGDGLHNAADDGTTSAGGFVSRTRDDRASGVSGAAFGAVTSASALESSALHGKSAMPVSFDGQQMSASAGLHPMRDALDAVLSVGNGGRAEGGPLLENGSAYNFLAHGGGNIGDVRDPRIYSELGGFSFAGLESDPAANPSGAAPLTSNNADFDLASFGSNPSSAAFVPWR